MAASFERLTSKEWACAAKQPPEGNIAEPLAGNALRLAGQLEKVLRTTNVPFNSDNQRVTPDRARILSFGTNIIRHPGPKKTNARHPEIFCLLQALTAYLTLPGEPIFNAWTVNVNVLSLPHVDSRNTAPSAIFCLGEFEGGRLCVERVEYAGDRRAGKPHNVELGPHDMIGIDRAVYRFDGAIFRHWTEEFRGERYAIIFYCHGEPRVQPEPQPGASMYVAILSAENDAAIADTLRIVEDTGLLHLATVFAAQDEMDLYQEAIDQAGLSVQLACAPPGPKEQQSFILDHFYPPDSRVVVLTGEMTERDTRDALMPATEPRFFLYNMIYDTGFAPNPFHGFLSLACCKGQIRERARLGDFLLGVSTQTLGRPGHVIYAARVDEIISVSDYYRRHPEKRPSAVVLRTAELQTRHTDTPRVQQVGDACYEPMADGAYRQLLCVHSFADDPAKEQKKDTAGPVLISRTFLYYGRDGPAAPVSIKQAQAYRSNFAEPELTRLHEFVRREMVSGGVIRGPPHAWPEHDNSWKSMAATTGSGGAPTPSKRRAQTDEDPEAKRQQQVVPQDMEFCRRSGCDKTFATANGVPVLLQSKKTIYYCSQECKANTKPPKEGGAPITFPSEHKVWQITLTSDPSQRQLSTGGPFYQRVPGKSPPVSWDPGCGQRAVYWLLPPEAQKNYYMHGSDWTTAQDLDEHLRPFGLTVCNSSGVIKMEVLDHGFGSIKATTHCWLIQIKFFDNDVRHWMAFDGRARVLFVGLASGNGPNKNMFYLPDPAGNCLANRFFGSVLRARITAAFVIYNI